MRGPGPTSQSREWKQARRAAFVQDALAIFAQRPLHLLSFDEVSHKLQLSNVHYLDLQTVALEQIVGSVNRYHDFTRAFYPRRDHLQDRWQRIESLVTTGRDLPPVELYKVGQAFFVRDGNHRVSVAHQRGTSTIKAYVWEYETEVPLEPDCDVDALLCATAHAAFLERTNIDRVCPDLHIELTQPDAYQDLLDEIVRFQQIFSTIDRRQVPFDEAVGLWSEIRYAPIIEIIRERHVLQDFPGRTETDLYLWLCRNREELEACHEEHVMMAEAADDLSTRFSEKPFPARRIRITARTLAENVASWTIDCWTASRQALRRWRAARRPPQAK
jgi:hypothetical protein